MRVAGPSRAIAGALLLVPAIFASGCASSGLSEPKGPPAALTALPRPLSDAEQQIIAASNDFSFSLLGQLTKAQPKENVFVSPLSASMALGMTMNGAANETFDVMRATLGFASTADQQQMNAGYKSLLSLLGGLDPSAQLEIANSIWYRQGFPFYQSFLDAARGAFGAEVHAANFDDPAATKSVVNGWVDQKTHGKITNILDDVRTEDVMYLLNAIYFKGSWRQQFNPSDTRDASFHAADGSTQPARLMSKEDTLSYFQTPDLQIVEMPYGNGAFAMTVALPRAGTDIDAFAASLSRADWDRWLASAHTQKVHMYLPKFRISYERKMNEDLSALGMGVAFDKMRADFSRMAPISADANLYISVVKQKSFVDVNEEGTEAAAVTFVGISVTSMPVIPEIRVDRPFVFAIRERLSGTILFIGKIARLPS